MLARHSPGAMTEPIDAYVDLARSLADVAGAIAQRYFRTPVAVDDSYKADVLLPVKQKLNADLKANPKLLGKEAQRITVSSRLTEFATALGPVGAVREHLDKARKALGPIPDPPFATEADYISRNGD